MKSTAAISLLLLLPGIQAVALPQGHNSRFKSDLGTLFNEAGDFIGNSPVANGPVAKMLPRKGDRVIEDDRSPVAKMLARKRKEGKAIKLHRSPTKVVRSPQGPDSNPGESIDPGLSRLNPANSKPSSDSIALSDSMASSDPMASSSAMSPSTNANDTMDADIQMAVMDDGYDYHHNHSYHNGTHHNGTHHHRDHGYYNGSRHHGEHNRTYHNGTHHHHHHYNETKHDLEMDMDMEMYILNATFGASGTAVPAVPGPISTGSAPVPSHVNARGGFFGPGFTGPKAKREGKGKENKWLSGIF